MRDLERFIEQLWTDAKDHLDNACHLTTEQEFQINLALAKQSAEYARKLTDIRLAMIRRQVERGMAVDNATRSP